MHVNPAVRHFILTFFPHNVLELGADGAIIMASLAIVFVLTYFKKWKWLWREYLTTVDHKKIGIMYIIAAITMLFRGGSDAILMRSQLAFPNEHFLSANHYDEIFTTHGTVMILFMAMPFVIGLFNVAVPLQIGARDVAFPYLNAISFWLFFVAALLFNLSFVVGGSPNAGWTSYTPLAGAHFDPGPGENYYLIALQITGIGTIATGVNFLVTILKMRAPGMTLMRMPMFTWSVLITSILIIFAFPVLAVDLALLLIDRLFGAHFFTISAGGMPMQWVNLFWIWGHPEVYIVILPLFGVFSEVVATFSRKRLFGYGAMVVSLLAISILSFVVWVHHFFTMGAGVGVNDFFGVSTMLIAVPTGVKMFNWLFTMWRGRVEFAMPMLWALAFIPTFLIGGLSGVMLAVAPADYQYHNSYFLVAHFHYVLVGGTVFGCFAGMYYWWPKMFGVKLDERTGRWAFWTWIVSFNVCFLPMFVVGLMGMTRRMYTYPAGLGWMPYNFVETIGAYGMAIGFVLMVYNIVYSIRKGERDLTGDPWDGRTLEWSTTSPAPEYNFAVTPVVHDRDEWWYQKYVDKSKKEKPVIRPIHMPNNSGRPITLAAGFGLAGFGFVFAWYVPAILGLLIVLICLGARSFELNTDHYIPVDVIERTEAAAGRL
ncbi:MAG: cytochrome aa3 quinol oxidase subunit I [Alicyclobacillaceae bacterium]|jgi:cytochrome aa3-600 menaquinol oxidase subunit 1|uniref:cytochrome aa3 quinol oxidase subunit I n=1 Tax=Alicyclobacillus sp. SP_1 TaxID=2942475 RepID=UPI002157787E|nr:cytochrome aa3 quinol oxidase subunit I [Alicyclobacillus sp. SP_1]MCY0889228.1 cytochrome aa3 quinol oxidase subunit I [Alicyclobacillaceae bacterium]MCY0895006.1 cytochrome aa3 quinol oxidase subunit I [Alicyclobacillaceae bacterium]